MKTAKFLSILTFVALVAALIGGCAPAAKPYECTDPKGCVTIGPNEPVRIGYAMVLSGSNASLGTDTKRGAEIAIDDKKNILGHAIELSGEDSMCSPEGGQAAAQKLAADPKLVAVIGTNCSSAARAAIPIICAANIAMVGPSTTAVDLTKADRPPEYWCFVRTAFNDLVQGSAMAQYAWETGFRKAATCHDGSIYADQLQQVFAENFKKLGGTITAQEAVGPDDTDMKPMLTRVAATGPDFFYFPIFVQAGGQITKQAKEVPGMENVQLAGADGLYTPDFLKAAGDAALGFNWSSPLPSGAPYEEFLTKHQAKYGETTLAPFHAHSYDAFMMIATAIEKVAVKDADGTLHIPRKALVDALFATKDFKGLTGTLTCSATGDCADPVLATFVCTSSDPDTWNPGAAADSNPKKIWPK